MYLIKSPSYWILLVAASIRNIAGYAIGAWLPTYFVREYGVTSAEFGLPVGFVVLCGGTMGSLLGGFVTDRYVINLNKMSRKVRKQSKMILALKVFGMKHEVIDKSLNPTFGS